MAQLASTTLAYDQIYFKIRDFFINSRNNRFKTLEDEAVAYGELLRDIYSNIGSPIAQYDPYIKGEPPRSSKLNKFSKSYADDLNLLGRQIDFLSAKTVSIFNMFLTEIESEKKYLERIGSKISLLQMYSRSPSNNLYYFGDSFDNMDKVDITKIKERFVPLISGGQCTLPISRSQSLRARKVYINKTEGFLGNSHQVKRVSSSDETDIYRFVFEDVPNVGLLTAIGDSNPLTFVEFEVLNVDRSGTGGIEGSVPQDWEFTYLNKDSLLSGSSTGVINWSNFDMTEPLELSYVIEFAAGKANVIEIVPYFGSNNLLKIKNIKITRRDGVVSDLLISPIYIGNTLLPADATTAKDYFYNKAVIKFSETEIIKAEIFFEQEMIEQIEIGHIFWKPNYPANSSPDSPFIGQSRFNPEGLSREVYEEIEYDLNEIIPESDNPTKFKRNGMVAKNIPLRLKTKPISYRFWVISFEKDLQFDGSEVFSKSYFNGWKTDIAHPEDGINFSNSISFINEVPSVRYYTSQESALVDLEAFSALVTNAENEIIALDGNFDYKIRNIISEEVTYNTSGVVSNYYVPVISGRQILPAKRKSIGLRDISVYNEFYSNKAEVVSQIFNYDKPIESIALSVDANVDNSYVNKININYYISVVDGKWIPISPIQLDSRGIAEVIFFNKNTSEAARLPGAAYLNYPTVPKDVKQVRVKIEMNKNRENNVTPIIYSYELIAKVSS